MLSQQTEKAKNICFIPSAHRLNPRCPVSAMPTAFASQIGQFPPYDISPSIANRKSKKYVLHPVSAGTSTRPPCTFSGRADNACTNLLGFFVRYVRTRGTAEIAGSATLPISSLPFAAHTCHAWLARLTRARRGGSEGGRRKSSLLTFGTFLHRKVR
jgi:hypothetical protein